MLSTRKEREIGVLEAIALHQPLHKPLTGE